MHLRVLNKSDYKKCNGNLGKVKNNSLAGKDKMKFQRQEAKEIDFKKDRQRQQAKAARDQLSKAEWQQQSKQMIDRLFSLPEYQNCQELLLYCAISSEVSTDNIISTAAADGKRIFCPKTYGYGQMEFYRILSTKDLQPGRYNIPEPGEEERFVPAKREKTVLILLPGLAFDRRRYRLGYGGGYYDRYLERLCAAKCPYVSAALAFEIQMVNQVITAEHDQKMDLLITPSEVVRRV